MTAVEILWPIPSFLSSCCFNTSIPQIWADFSFLHWPDTERWSLYVTRSSCCTANACSVAVQPHVQPRKSSANLAIAGPFCCHRLCCILFSQSIILPSQLGEDLSWVQKKGHLVFFGLGIMLLFRIFSWEDSLEQHSLARGTAGATPGILTLDAPRQAVGKDRQTEILFVRSFRLLQLQPCLSCIWTIRNKGELLASTEAGFEPLPSGRSWCGSAQIVTCGLQVAWTPVTHGKTSASSRRPQTSPVRETVLEELTAASLLWEHLQEFNKNGCLTECQAAGGLEGRVINTKLWLPSSCWDLTLQSEGRLGINLFQVLSGFFTWGSRATIGLVSLLAGQAPAYCFCPFANTSLP